MKKINFIFIEKIKKSNLKSYFIGFEGTKLTCEIGRKFNIKDLGCYFELDEDEKIIFKHNTILFDQLFISFSNFYEVIENLYSLFYFFINRNTDKNDYYYFWKDYLNNQIFNNQIKLENVFDMTLIILSKYSFELYNQNILCFNLPAGAGKTYQIDWIYKFLNNNVIVTCPTAKACTHFKEANAKTIHSKFHIDFKSFSVNSKTFQEEVYIIDECSMLQLNILCLLLSVINNNNKHIILIGDFAQLLPVKGQSILNYKNLKIFNAHKEKFYLPRFKNDEITYLIRLLRYRILYNKIPDDMNYDYFLKIVNKINVSNNLADEFKKITMDNFKQTISLLEDSNIDQIPDCIPPFISYSNKNILNTNNELAKSLNSETKLESTIFIQESEYNFLNDSNNYLNFSNFLSNMGPILGEEGSSISIGTWVCIKKNNYKANLINGQTALVVGMKNINELRKHYINYNLTNKKIFYTYSKNLPSIILYDPKEKSLFELPFIKEKCNNINIYCAYIIPTLLLTVHQLQGSTIKENLNLLTGDDINIGGLLRNFYVIMSRCENLSSLYISSIIKMKFLSNFFSIKKNKNVFFLEE